MLFDHFAEKALQGAWWALLLEQLCFDPLAQPPPHTMSLSRPGRILYPAFTGCELGPARPAAMP